MGCPQVAGRWEPRTEEAGQQRWAVRPGRYGQRQQPGGSQDAETPGRGAGQAPSTRNLTSATSLSPSFQTKVKVKDSQLLSENARCPWWRPCKASPSALPRLAFPCPPRRSWWPLSGSTAPWGNGNRGLLRPVDIPELTLLPGGGGAHCNIIMALFERRPRGRRHCAPVHSQVQLGQGHLAAGGMLTLASSPAELLP